MTAEPEVRMTATDWLRRILVDGPVVSMRVKSLAGQFGTARRPCAMPATGSAWRWFGRATARRCARCGRCRLKEQRHQFNLPLMAYVPRRRRPKC